MERFKVLSDQFQYRLNPNFVVGNVVGKQILSVSVTSVYERVYSQYVVGKSQIHQPTGLNWCYHVFSRPTLKNSLSVFLVEHGSS